MTARRSGMLALLALFVPLPALALEGGSPSHPATAAMTVSVALDSCGLADTAVLCRINASWGRVDHADQYMVTVTSSDGSVTDFGGTGAAMTSLLVPYAGPGTYTVTVEAWGTPPQEEEPELIARATSGPTPEPTDTEFATPGAGSDKPAKIEEPEAPVQGDEQVAEPPVEETPCEEPMDAPIDPPPGSDAATIPECPTPPPAPSPSPPESSSTEAPESFSSEASG